MSQWSLNALPDLSEEEFQEWQALLETRTGISFDRHRHILQTGLTQRIREVGLHSYRDYFRQVRAGAQGAAEWEALLKTLTIKETRFFRDPDAYKFLREFLLSYIPEQKTASLELWSAACSTGEEAFSLAILVNQCMQQLKSDKFFGVTATDICLSTLAAARQGKYNKRKLDVLSAPLKQKYFDEQDQYYAVKPAIKSRVCFVQANLVQMDSLPIADLDVIFCHNVLIYFSKSVQYEVLDNLVKRLRVGGVLVIGSAEAQGWRNSQAQRIDNDAVQAFQRCA